MEPFEEPRNEELLSALAGKGAAQVLMEQYGGLTPLAQASCEELQQVKGVGKSKAAAIKSAFLLAQRLAKEALPDAPLLDTPEAIANLLRERNRLYTVEHFQVVFLNTRRRLIGVADLAQGSLDTLLVDPRQVFLAAIARRSAAIALAHNHPSGDPSPSEADIKVTRDLLRAGQLLKIEVVDHVILGQRTLERPVDFVSLRQLRYLSS